MKNRKLTVYSGTVGYNLIPKIILQGNWLDDLGFSIGDKVGVSCQQDKITVERIPEDQAQQTQPAEPETGGRQRKGNKNGRYKKVLEEAQKLKWSIESLLKLSGFEQNGDLSGLPIDHEDGKQLFLIEELQQIMEKLSDVDQKLKYLSIPVKEVSRLHKNRRGRYETSGGHSYTSGQGIEVLVPDSRPDGNCWVRTRVEHDGKDYYLVGYHDVCMEGLTVRIREGGVTMGATVYCLCNQKGGCAKTMSSVSIGIGLAREGKKVLLVDVDAQGSMTASLGYQHPDQMEVTLATVLGAVITDSPLPEGGGILHHEEGVDLLPANIELSGLEVTLVNTMSRETILRQYLQTVRDAYNVIILDCMPSLGMLTINALAAADEILIPVQAQYLSIKGLEQLIRTIARVKRQINPGLAISGILVTMADMRTNYAREIVEILHKTYDGKLRIFDSIIPLSVRASETSAEGKSIYLHDPAGKVAAAYQALTREVVDG